MKNKVLVTGIAGFIGFHTTKRLMEEGYEVIGLDNINDYYDINLKYARLGELGIPREEAVKWKNRVESEHYPSLTFVRMNLEDHENVQKLFEKEKFNLVIHLAAQAGVRYSHENPLAYINSNIVGFLSILEGCRHHNIQHLVYGSSSSVYGENRKVPFEESDPVDHPISLYAATKKSNELMAFTYSHLYEIPVTGLRFFTVYGPWGRPDMAPMLFASAITEDRPIKVFNQGDMQRDFTYIDDIVEGIFLALNHPSSEDEESPCYKLYNIGNGSPVHLMEFIHCLEKELGKMAQKKMLPMQPGDVSRTWADTSSIEALGYKSKTSIQAGIKKFVEWYDKIFSSQF